ncbi:hypothetical protein CCM_02849 [Cordyceps militaris CM01]|uniref:Uncharacterized protein n=2 Tax=Cordyceps militaris TaxID=73501 RepID=G3JC63_CORMM|nr:uncharacterized protein CCM_02849 [Cordyceps militaris CM01]ATY60567.1 Vacuolar sorting-associated VTA1 [Cordyceps militaris]EGX94578.1 hypothetical protein CCM_02849 [Cordyceps militaris CM01]
MAELLPLPAAFKIPEISRFINRANQLRAVKPAVAYWCEYHAVNQIVGKSLHTTDDDCFNFTRTLIERLEATKAERADDDAITDNTAGQAYVEMFAQETFDRAERTMRADKVTRQTADTFDAAATFFDLTREWGTPEADTLQKIKFAKWNAARILKAIRQGLDPNESNPKAPEPEPEDPAEVELDPTSQELASIGPSAQPVSLEEVPDAGEPFFPSVPFTTATAADTSGFPSAAPAATTPEPPFVPSPIATPPPQSAENLQPTPPTAPNSSRQQVPPQPSPQFPTKITPEHIPLPEPLPVQPREPPPPAMSWPTASLPAPVTAPNPANPVPTPAVHAPATNIPQKDLNQAQKHAKWAISALNFDDVPTAVKELRNALAMLGAQ